LLAEAFLARTSDECGAAADRFQVVVHVNQCVLTGRSPAPDGPFTPSDSGLCELEDERPLALDTVRRPSCDCSAVGIVENDDGEPLSIGRKSRSIPPALQRALRARDGGCRFPGCGRARFTEGHHVVHWADGGETKLANLVTLCRFHHRLVHEGGFGLHTVDDGPEHERFVFTRPDGTRVWPNGRHRFRGNYGSRVERSTIEPSDRPLPPDDPGELPLFALSREAALDINWRTSR
jgi:hypothetical protein